MMRNPLLARVEGARRRSGGRSGSGSQEWASVRRYARQRRQHGFTIMEIMIATAILTLGLVGILALFPVAIFNSKKVMDNSTAIVIAESVADAIREGLRNQRRFNRVGDEYFVFKHDGVMDRIPAVRAQEDHRKDYYILLPGYRRGGSGFSGRSRRRNALARMQTFCYPESDSPANGGGRRLRANNDVIMRTAADGREFEDILVKKTYSLGNLLPEEGTPDALPDQQIDTLRQFSYAFAISPSLEDSNLSPNVSTFIPALRLFHVRVMVFRSFHYSPESDDDASLVEPPIYELDFEVAI